MFACLFAFAIASAVGCVVTDETAGEAVEWSGFVYLGESTDSEDRLGDGLVSLDVPGMHIHGQQPYEDYPGYWYFSVPPGQPATLRLEGTGAIPTLWAGDTPTKDANWLGGTLFAATENYIENLLEDLGEDGDQWVLGAGSIDVLIVGIPSEPEWTCADVGVSVVGAPGGAEYATTCWAISETGEYLRAEADVPAVAFAVVVPAGETTLRFKNAVESYATLSGDVVLAYYLLDVP